LFEATHAQGLRIRIVANSEVFFFVSHVAENRDSALEIVGELERRGTRCWIAPRDIRPGRPFDDEIADAIENSRAMLLIFSDLCNDSEYIRREVTFAGESHKTVIPFRIENVLPRRGLRVRLSDLHWIDGFVSRERAIEEVLKTFSSFGNAETAIAAPAAPVQDAVHAAPPTATPRSKWDVSQRTADTARPSPAKPAASGNSLQFILFGCVAAAGLAGLGLFLATRNGETPAPPSPAALTQPAPTPKPTSPPAAATPAVKQAITLSGSGDADLVNKDYDRAIADYTQALQFDPKLAVAYNGRGSAYYEKNEFDRAIADHTEAIQLDPKLADAYFHRGIAYSYGKHDYDRAVADYTEAIQLDPIFAGAYFHRAIVYQNGTQDFDRALSDYQEVLSLDASFFLAHYNRGIIFQALKKDFNRAIAEYTEALRINPNYAPALYNRGVSKRMLGDTADGDADIAGAKALDPNVGK
jgi:Tfp pilus assembly protein PilF